MNCVKINIILYLVTFHASLSDSATQNVRFSVDSANISHKAADGTRETWPEWNMDVLVLPFRKMIRDLRAVLLIHERDLRRRWRRAAEHPALSSQIELLFSYLNVRLYIYKYWTISHVFSVEVDIKG